MHPVPEAFTEGGITLRRPRQEDADAIWRNYARHPETCRFLMWRPHRDVHDTRSFLEQCDRNWESGFEWTWCILDPDVADGEPVGMVACRHRDHKVDLGYVLAPRLWRRGIMTLAVTSLLGRLREIESVHRIWAVCDVANVASARVLEKAGMSREGVLRRWAVYPNLSTEPRDCFVYAWVR